MIDGETAFDVVVVGAGPTGLTAAILASRTGAHTAIVAPPAPPQDERTVAMLGASVDILRDAGVWSDIETHGAPLRTMRLVDATRRLIRAPLVEFHASEIGRDAFGYNVPNAILTEALERQARAAGITRIEASAAALVAEADHVRVTTSLGTVVTAKLLGGADGRRSKARDVANIPVRSWAYRQSALVANIRHSLPHDDVSTEFHTETGPFTLVPLPGNRCGIVCVERPAEAERLFRLSDAELGAEFERRSRSLVGRITIEGNRQLFPLSGQTARRFADRRIALIGEAAHVFPPIGAQGLNLGLRDAAMFAAAVAHHRDDPGSAAALSEYDRSRTGDILSRTTAIDALNRSLLTSFLPVQLLRGAGLFTIAHLAPLKRAVMRQGLTPHL